MSESAQLPMTVLGGFLGSGKTTLLNNILRAPHGLRILVMVNDFGSLNVDASLIKSGNAAQDVINLTNGCVCCTMGGELIGALLKVEKLAPDLDWLIIEGSGVSDPKKIAQIGQAGGSFRLRSIVTLTDASTVREMAADRYVGDVVLQQINSAHLILLNKTDLVNEQQRASTIEWLSEKAPTAMIFESVQAEIDWEILLNPPLRDSSTLPTAKDGSFKFMGQFGSQSGDTARHFSTLTIAQRAPYDEPKLKAALRALPSSVFRIKGIVSVGREARPFLLQYSPNKEYELQTFKDAQDGLTGKLIAIGSGNLNKESLIQLFNSAELS